MAMFKYDIVNRAGETVESNIPARDQAETYVEFLRQTHPHEEYTVVEIRIYDKEARRYGRDPDLH